MIPEEIDLEELRRKLSARFVGAAPAGYVRGKGDRRDEVDELERHWKLGLD